MDLNLVFLGTPQFAVPSLERLVSGGFRVSAVFTQPDRPKGRGQEQAASPVKQAAERLGLPVYQPERIKEPVALERLQGIRPEAMAVVGYGQIIPQSILDLAPMGIINVHASLLPKYRGAAPIQWAIANGETRTGVTTMRIDAGLDTGDLLLAWEAEIGPEETAVELSQRLAEAGADLLVETLRGLVAGVVAPQPQDPEAATYAPVLKKEDGEIDWNWPANQIHNRIRAFQPWPGCYTWHRGRLLHIWRARPAAETLAAPPGTLHPMRRRLLAACGEGTVLELLEVQQQGRKRISAEAFLHGQRLEQTESLGEKPT